MFEALDRRAPAHQRPHGALLGCPDDRGGQRRPAVRLAALERQLDVTIGLKTRQQLEFGAGEFLQKQWAVMRIRTRSGRAYDKLVLEVLQLLEALVGQVRSDREQRPIRTGGAQPFELLDV